MKNGIAVLGVSVPDAGLIKDRPMLMEHCGSEQLPFDLLRQMERLLEESAQKLDQKRLLLKSLKPALWFIPVLGWIILYKNREVFANLNEYGSLAAFDNKIELERRSIGTEKLIRDFANSTLAKGIYGYRRSYE